MIINGYNIVTGDDGVKLRQDHVYTYLKAVNGETDIKTLLSIFRGIEPIEIEKGIIEYNYATKQSSGYLKPFEGSTKKQTQEYLRRYA